jgi:cytoskeletal protein CcmA (bactofilin family)
MLFKQTTPRADQSATAAADRLPATRPLPPVPTAAGAALDPLERPVAPKRSMTDEPETGKRLIVGEGIQLKGEITACERLIVEGEVEVTMNATRALEIKPSGRFTGSCEVEDAEISGVYEGDLSVRGRLTVHRGGRVVGKIAYGELELERGGEIAGELSVRSRQPRGQASNPPAAVKSNQRGNAAAA